MRKGFLNVDTMLNNGGLEEVAQTKRDNPPKKSNLMKILNDVTGKKAAGAGAAATNDDENNETPQDDEDLALDSIGCTANVAMIDYSANKLYVANAGDSRCVMGKNNGTCVPLSFDHKPENEEELARIEASGSVVTEGRVDGHLNLSRSIGDLKFKKKDLAAEAHPITANPDCYEYDFGPEVDFILMGCDGCWETKSNEEMVEWVYKKLEEAPDKSTRSLKIIVSDLLNELISPNHQQTGK